MTIGNGCGRKRRPVHVRQAAKARVRSPELRAAVGQSGRPLPYRERQGVTAGALYFVKGAAAATSMNNTTMPAIYANASAMTFSAEKPAGCDSVVVITVTTRKYGGAEEAGCH